MRAFLKFLLNVKTAPNQIILKVNKIAKTGTYYVTLKIRDHRVDIGKIFSFYRRM